MKGIHRQFDGTHTHIHAGFDFSRSQVPERGKVEAGSFEGTLPRFSFFLASSSRLKSDD